MSTGQSVYASDLYGYSSTGTVKQLPKCPSCGALAHDAGLGACPEVAEVEYFETGNVKRFRKYGP